MAVSGMIPAIQSLFATPEYSSRIPANVKTAIANGTFGSTDFSTQEYNAVMDLLVDKIARQNIYSFVYNGLDASKYSKGYMPAGGIIEDDYVDAMEADDVDALPSTTSGEYNSSTFDFSKYNPFKINYPRVKPSYYMTKYFLQYHVTTTLDMFKRAFISEGGAVDFVSRIRGVLPESAKLDKYLIFKNMLANGDNLNIYASDSEVKCVVAGEHFTAAESIAIVTQIRNMVSALKYNTTKYNKLGVLTSTNSNDLVLFIAEGIYNELSAAQYNAYHKDLDFGCRVQLIDGFGTPALTSGQFACLIDERKIQMYDWQRDRMDNIWNPTSTGYWNTYYSYGGLIGYALHANAIRFVLDDGTV